MPALAPPTSPIRATHGTLAQAGRPHRPTAVRQPFAGSRRDIPGARGPGRRPGRRVGTQLDDLGPRGPMRDTIEAARALRERTEGSAGHATGTGADRGGDRSRGGGGSGGVDGGGDGDPFVVGGRRRRLGQAASFAHPQSVFAPVVRRVHTEGRLDRPTRPGNPRGRRSQKAPRRHGVRLRPLEGEGDAAASDGGARRAHERHTGSPARAWATHDAPRGGGTGADTGAQMFDAAYHRVPPRLPSMPGGGASSGTSQTSRVERSTASGRRRGGLGRDRFVRALRPLEPGGGASTVASSAGPGSSSPRSARSGHAGARGRGSAHAAGGRDVLHPPLSPLRAGAKSPSGRRGASGRGSGGRPAFGKVDAGRAAQPTSVAALPYA